METDTDKEAIDDNIPITKNLNNEGNLASSSDTIESVDHAANEKEVPSSSDIEENKFDEFLPTQGSYPPHIKQPLVNYIPLDKTYTGISDVQEECIYRDTRKQWQENSLALDMNWIDTKALISQRTH